jgi:chromosome segregation ATPase
MGYEPRMRGRRFRRPLAKKMSAREKREERGTSIFYHEPEQINPSLISSKSLNAIEHLGNQRFALPPFSEHFQRWVKDLKALLGEFEIQLPDAVDQQYRENVEKLLINVQEALTRHIEAEKNSSSEISDLHRQLAAMESELSKLDHDYKTLSREIKTRHEKSMGKLRAEIDSLDKQRLKILRKRTSFLQRIFGKSESKLEEKTKELQSKRDALGNSRETLKEELDTRKTDYEIRRKRLAEEHQELRVKLGELKENGQDDALEIRKAACEELHRSVSEAVERLSQEQNPADAEHA